MSPRRGRGGAGAWRHGGSDISFAGPRKRDAELEAAIRAGVTINLESIAARGARAGRGRALGVTPRLAVRVNPDFELRGSGMKMGGRASPFGIESAQVPELVKLLRGEGAAWRGLHIFAGSQSLDTEAIIATQAATVDLAARLADACGAVPPLVNLGGGFGIPISRAARRWTSARSARRWPGRSPGLVACEPTIAIELGRWLVGEAGGCISPA